MVDRVSASVRSGIMASVKNRNTTPEVKLRKELHEIGLRYRLHAPDLPGTPDIVFPRFKAVVFVHGCFWHGHSCNRGALPATNTEFWRVKIGRNQIRDVEACRKLESVGWRSLVVWECSLRNRGEVERTALSVKGWLLGE